VGRRLRRHVLRPDLEAHQRTRFPKTGCGDFRIAGELDKAQNSLWKLGDLIVSRVLAPSVHVKRTKANVKKAAGEGNASSFAHFCKL
jgi:hypothetical protein